MSNIIKSKQDNGIELLVVENFEESFLPWDNTGQEQEYTQDTKHITPLEEGIVNPADDYRRGYEEGIIKAEEVMRETYNAMFSEDKTQMQKLIESMHEQFVHLHKKSEYLVLRFAIAVAEKIVKRSITMDDKIILSQIKDALNRIVGVDQVKIRINPDDAELVKSNKSTIKGTSDSIREIVFETDDKIERGSCIIESESGNVDARIASQLSKLEDILINNVSLKVG